MFGAETGVMLWLSQDEGACVYYVYIYTRICACSMYLELYIYIKI